MDVRIRKAAIEDYGALCELHDEVVALHCDHLPHSFRKPDCPVREHDYILGLIDDEDSVLFVAEVGQLIVGFVQTALRDPPPFPEFVPISLGMVDSIVVRSGYRDRGIGRQLMDAAHAWAVAKGATTIQLNVYDFNKAATAFYESLGYQTLSRKMFKALDA